VLHHSLVQIKKVDDLRGDISRLELSVGAAKAEYDKLKAANLAETARFAAERRAEYLQMLENFTATQVWLALWWLGVGTGGWRPYSEAGFGHRVPAGAGAHCGDLGAAAERRAEYLQVLENFTAMQVRLGWWIGVGGCRPCSGADCVVGQLWRLPTGWP
jgi:hypothetical protein